MQHTIAFRFGDVACWALGHFPYLGAFYRPFFELSTLDVKIWIMIIESGLCNVSDPGSSAGDTPVRHQRFWMVAS